MTYSERAIKAISMAEHLANGGSPGTLEAAKVEYLQAIAWALLAVAVAVDSFPKE